MSELTIQFGSVAARYIVFAMFNFFSEKEIFFFFFLCDFISVFEGVLNTKYNVVGPVHWSYCKCDINKIDALTLELGKLFPQINSVSQNFMSISQYH